MEKWFRIFAKFFESKQKEKSIYYFLISLMKELQI